MVFESKIRRKLEKIRENVNILNGYMEELLKEIEEEKGHSLRGKIKDEKAILKLEREEYDAAVKIQNNAVEAFTVFREIINETPEELKNKLPILEEIYKLIQQINQEVVKINTTPHFSEIANSAVRIEDYANQALQNVDKVYDDISEHWPAYSNWALKHFHT